MAWWHDLKKFKEWVQTATDEEIAEVKRPAVKGIECERCKSEHGVYCYDCFNMHFFCDSCFEIFKSEEVTSSNSRGLSLRFRILERDNFTCIYCGRNPKDDGVKLEVDHIIPRAKGGVDAPENLVTACYECNQGKKDFITQTIIDYAARRS